MELLEAGTFVLDRLNGAGYEAYFVGGMVRDRLLGRELHDVDIATAATPDQVQSLFERTVPTGLAHGTVTVLVETVPIEVTTYRVDGDYLDQRRPDTVVFTPHLEEDLRRRDFTVNAMAMDQKGQIIDPLQGAADLRSGMIRAVGNAQQRFSEDPLRMLRGLRFVSKLGFFLDGCCREAMISEGHLLGGVSRERVLVELEGLMAGAHKIRALELFKETGLMGRFQDFRALEQLDPKALAPFNKGVDLLILAAYFGEDKVGFLKGWPITRSDRRLIAKVLEALEGDLPLAWVQYRDGVETAKAVERFRRFLGREGMPLPLALPLASRKDLALSTEELLEAGKVAPGPQSGRFLEAIEQAVVLGKIPNRATAILQLVELQTLPPQK